MRATEVAREVIAILCGFVGYPLLLVGLFFLIAGAVDGGRWAGAIATSGAMAAAAGGALVWIS